MIISREMLKYIYKIELDKVIANMLERPAVNIIFAQRSWNFSKRGNNKSGRNRRKGKTQAICEYGAQGVIMVIGDFNFSYHTLVYLLTGVKLIMEIQR